MASRKQSQPPLDSPKPGSSSDVSTGAPPDSSGPSGTTKKPEKTLQDPLPEEFKQFRTYEDLCKWVQKDENYNDFIQMFNSCVKGDKIRREKYPPIVYSIVVNDRVLAGDDWKFVKVGFTQIDTQKETGNRMENVMTQIKRNGYKTPTVLFKLPIRAIDTTPFLETEERIRKHFGFLVDKNLAKRLNLPVKTEWVLNSQENITNYKEIEKRSKDTKSTGVFKENKSLQFETKMKKDSGAKTAQELEDWLKQNKQFPTWLRLSDKDGTFEVYQQGDLPAELEEHLQQQKSTQQM